MKQKTWPGACSAPYPHGKGIPLHSLYKKCIATFCKAVSPLFCHVDIGPLYEAGLFLYGIILFRSEQTSIRCFGCSFVYAVQPMQGTEAVSTMEHF